MLAFVKNMFPFRGDDDPHDSLVSISEGLDRRRISCHTETLKSTRSEQSPRLRRPHQSVSVPPETPPLSRAPPYRHSISDTPQTGQPTVIAVQTQCRPRSQSRDSLEPDSGNPESEVTNSERAGPGSESDSRSLDFDSFSVDEVVDESSEILKSLATVCADPSSGTTVIHVSGGPSSMSTFHRDTPVRDVSKENRKIIETEVRLNKEMKTPNSPNINLHLQM